MSVKIGVNTWRQQHMLTLFSCQKSMFRSVNMMDRQHGLFDVLMITLANILFKLVCFARKCQASAMTKCVFVTLLNKVYMYSTYIDCMKVSDGSQERCDRGTFTPFPPIHTSFLQHPFACVRFQEV